MIGGIEILLLYGIILMAVWILRLVMTELQSIPLA